MNKASGGDGIPAELFQILKDDVVKVLHLICQQIWKTQQCQASLSFTITQSLLKLMSIESVMSSSHFILCRPLLLLRLGAELELRPSHGRGLGLETR